MAQPFNLTAQLNLKGPANIKQIAARIRKDLGTIDANVKFKLDPSAIKNTTALTSALNKLNTTFYATAKSAGSATSAIKAFGSAISSINIKNVPQQLNASATAITKLNSSAQSSGKALATVSTEMQEFGRQAGLAVRRFTAFSTVTSIIYGVTNSINQGVQAFIDYDKELVKLQQVTGESAQGLGKLQSQISNLSVDLGVSSKELTSVALTLAQAGLSAKDTERALKALALSSLAPSFDNMNETVEGSIALMRQFDISAAELEQSLGAVNAVSAKFAVEASDIITAIQRTGSVFATASKGVSEGKDALNEFIAVFTSVRATTRESAETIATGLRTIFTRIQRSSTIDALKEFGVNLTDAQGKFVGAYKAVQLLSQGLSSIDPRSLQFSKIVEELGGFRQIGKVIPLIQQFSVAQEALKVAQKGQSSLANDAAVAQLSLANQIAKVREEFFALFREIGSSKGFQTIVKGALDLTSGLLKVADAAKSLLPALTVLVAFKGAKALTQFASGFASGVRPAPAQQKGAPQKFFEYGGPVRKFARGGLVPGSGNRDTVPAMLTPGEFVIRKKAVETIGSNRLQKMNKYARGGTVKKDKDIIRYGSENIVDGDTFGAEALTNKEYRLSEVDAVESGTKYGTNAKKVLESKRSELIDSITKSTGGAYGRGLFRKEDIAKTLVEKGYGVPDKRFARKNIYDAALETAKKEGRGIWSAGNENHPKRILYEAEHSQQTAKDLALSRGLNIKKITKGRYRFSSGGKIQKFADAGKVEEFSLRPGETYYGELEVKAAKAANEEYKRAIEQAFSFENLYFEVLEGKSIAEGVTPEVYGTGIGALKKGEPGVVGTRKVRLSKAVNDTETVSVAALDAMVENLRKSALNAREAQQKAYTDAQASIIAFKTSGLLENIDPGILGFIKDTIPKLQAGMVDPEIWSEEGATGIDLVDIQKKLTKPNLQAFAGLTEGKKVEVQGQRTKLSEVFNAILETYGSNVSPMEQSNITGAVADKFIKQQSKDKIQEASLGGLIQKFMAGGVAEPLSDQEIETRLGLLGGAAGISGVVSASRLAQLAREKLAGASYSRMLLKLPTLQKQLKSDQGSKYRDFISAVIREAEGLNVSDANRIAALNDQAQQNYAGIFGGAGMYQDGTFSTGKINLIPDPKKQRAIDKLKKPTSIEIIPAVLAQDEVMKQARLQAAKAQKADLNTQIGIATSETAESVAKQYGAEAQLGRISEFNKKSAIAYVSAVADALDTKSNGSRIFLDFDKTLAYGADDIGKVEGSDKIDLSAFSDITKVKAGLGNAKLSSLGKKLIQLNSDMDKKQPGLGAELLKRLFVVSARPSNTMSLISGWLNSQGLNIPAGNFVGVGAQGLSETDIAIEKAKEIIARGGLQQGSVFIDDDPRNIKRSREQGIISKQYGATMTPQFATEATQTEGLNYQDLVRQTLASYDPTLANAITINKQGQSLDFPNGLGPLASTWFDEPRLATIPTDVKRTITQSKVIENIANYLRLAKGYAFGGKVDGPKFEDIKQQITDKYPEIDFRISKRKKGRGFGYNLLGALKSDGGLLKSKGLKFQQPGNLQQLIEESDKMANNLMNPKEFALGGLAESTAEMTGLISGLYGNRSSDETAKKQKNFGKIGLRAGGSDITATYFKNAEREGMVSAKKASGNLFTIGLSKATGGYGPKLYDIVMEAATAAGGMLTSDRSIVSKDAQGVWSYYFNRRNDVKKTPLDPKDWTKNSQLVDPRLYGKKETWPPFDDPAWILQTGYSKNPELINGPDVINMNDPKYAGFIAQQQLGFLNRNTGGGIRKFAKGGSAEDTVPALLTPGEFVINKKAAQRIGYDSLHKLNKADKLQGYNKGGAVGFVQRFADGGLVQGFIKDLMDALASSGLNRPETISRSTVGVDDKTIQSVKDLASALNKLGMSVSNTADILNAGGRTSYKELEKAMKLDIERLRLAGAGIEAITAAETELASVREKRSKEVQDRKNLEGAFSARGKAGKSVLGGMTIGDLQAGSGAGQQAIESQAQMLIKAKIASRGGNVDAEDRQKIMESSYLQAASRVSGIKKSEFTQANISGSDIQKYISESMRDRKTLADMDKQLIAIKMQEYQSAGKTAAEARKLADQEVSERRQIINKLAAQNNEAGVGAASMFDFKNSPIASALSDRYMTQNKREPSFFGTGLKGTLASDIGLAAGLIGGQGKNIATQFYGSSSSPENQMNIAKTGAAIEQAGTTLSTGLMAASQMLTIPVVGPWLAGLTALGTAAYAAVDYFTDFSGAQKAAALELERSLRASALEDSTDKLNKAFKDFEADVTNIDLQKKLSAALAKQTTSASDLGLTEFKQLEQTKIKSMGTMEWMFGAKPDISNQDIGSMSRTQAERSAASASQAFELMRAKIDSGVTSIADLAKDKAAVTAIGAGDVDVQEQVNKRILALAQQMGGLEKVTEVQRRSILEEVSTRSFLNNEQVKAAIKAKGLADALAAADRAGRKLAESYDRLFNSIEQSINRIEYEASERKKLSDLRVSGLTGEAKMPDVSFKDINVLQNRKAYTPKEYDQALASATATLPQAEGTRLREAATLEAKLGDNINSAIASAVKGQAGLDLNQAAEIATKTAKAEIDALNISDELKTNLKSQVEARLNTLKESTQKEKGGNQAAAVDAFIEDAQKTGSIIGDVGKKAQDMAVALLSTRQKAINEFISSVSDAGDAARKAADLFRKARDIRSEGRRNLREVLTGVGETYNDTRTRVMGDVGALTGGITDPTQIRQQIQQTSARLEQQAAIVRDPNATPDQVKDATIEFERLKTSLKNSQEALDTLANSTELVEKTFNDLKNARELQKNRESFVNQLLTNTPEEADKLSQTFIRLQRNLSGGLNTAANQRDARKEFNETLRRTGSVREATRAGNTVLANQRKETLGLMQDQGFRASLELQMGNAGMDEAQIADRMKQMETQLMTQMARESGMMNNPLVQQAIRAKQNPNADPMVKQRADRYLEAVGLRAKATEEQATLQLAASNQTLIDANNQLAAAINDLKTTIATATNKDKAIEGGEVDAAGQKKVPMPVAAVNVGGKAKGGLIYASMGQLIDFQPKGTDTVPAMLTPGEFVINARATAQHLPLLQAINDGQVNTVTKAFSKGGLVYLGGGGPAKPINPKTVEAINAVQPTDVANATAELDDISARQAARSNYTATNGLSEFVNPERVADEAEHRRLIDAQRQASMENQFAARFIGRTDGNYRPMEDIVKEEAARDAQSRMGNTWDRMSDEQKNKAIQESMPRVQAVADSYKAQQDAALASGTNIEDFRSQAYRTSYNNFSNAVDARIDHERDMRDKSESRTTGSEIARRNELTDFIISNYGSSTPPPDNIGAGAIAIQQARMDASVASAEAEVRAREATKVSLNIINRTQQGPVEPPPSKAVAMQARIDAEVAARKQDAQTASKTASQIYAEQAQGMAPKTTKDLPKPKTKADIPLYWEGVQRGMTVDELKYEKQQQYLSNLTPEARDKALQSLSNRNILAKPSARQNLMMQAQRAKQQEAAINTANPAQLQDMIKNMSLKEGIGSGDIAKARQAITGSTGGPGALLASSLNAEQQSLYNELEQKRKKGAYSLKDPLSKEERRKWTELSRGRALGAQPTSFDNARRRAISAISPMDRTDEQQQEYLRLQYQFEASKGRASGSFEDFARSKQEMQFARDDRRYAALSNRSSLSSYDQKFVDQYKARQLKRGQAIVTEMQTAEGTFGNIADQVSGGIAANEKVVAEARSRVAAYNASDAAQADLTELTAIENQRVQSQFKEFLALNVGNGVNDPKALASFFAEKGGVETYFGGLNKSDRDRLLLSYEKQASDYIRSGSKEGGLSANELKTLQTKYGSDKGTGELIDLKFNEQLEAKQQQINERVLGDIQATLDPRANESNIERIQQQAAAYTRAANELAKLNNANNTAQIEAYRQRAEELSGQVAVFRVSDMTAASAAQAISGSGADLRTQKASLEARAFGARVQQAQADKGLDQYTANQLAAQQAEQARVEAQARQVEADRVAAENARKQAEKEKQDSLWINSSNPFWATAGYLGGVMEATGNVAYGAANVVAGATISAGGRLYQGGAYLAGSEAHQAAGAAFAQVGEQAMGQGAYTAVEAAQAFVGQGAIQRGEQSAIAAGDAARREIVRQGMGEEAAFITGAAQNIGYGAASAATALSGGASAGNSILARGARALGAVEDLPISMIGRGARAVSSAGRAVANPIIDTGRFVGNQVGEMYSMVKPGLSAIDDATGISRGLAGIRTTTNAVMDTARSLDPFASSTSRNFIANNMDAAYGVRASSGEYFDAARRTYAGGKLSPEAAMRYHRAEVGQKAAQMMKRDEALINRYDRLTGGDKSKASGVLRSRAARLEDLRNKRRLGQTDDAIYGRTSGRKFADWWDALEAENTVDPKAYNRFLKKSYKQQQAAKAGKASLGQLTPRQQRLMQLVDDQIAKQTPVSSTSAIPSTSTTISPTPKPTSPIVQAQTAASAAKSTRASKQARDSRGRFMKSAQPDTSVKLGDLTPDQQKLMAQVDAQLNAATPTPSAIAPAPVRPKPIDRRIIEKQLAKLDDELNKAYRTYGSGQGQEAIRRGKYRSTRVSSGEEIIQRYQESSLGGRDILSTDEIAFFRSMTPEQARKWDLMENVGYGSKYDTAGGILNGRRTMRTSDIYSKTLEELEEMATTSSFYGGKRDPNLVSIEKLLEDQKRLQSSLESAPSVEEFTKAQAEYIKEQAAARARLAATTRPAKPTSATTKTAVPPKIKQGIGATEELVQNVTARQQALATRLTEYASSEEAAQKLLTDNPFAIKEISVSDAIQARAVGGEAPVRSTGAGYSPNAQSIKFTQGRLARGNLDPTIEHELGHAMQQNTIGGLGKKTKDGKLVYEQTLMESLGSDIDEFLSSKSGYESLRATLNRDPYNRDPLVGAMYPTKTVKLEPVELFTSLIQASRSPEFSRNPQAVDMLKKLMKFHGYQDGGLVHDPRTLSKASEIGMAVATGGLSGNVGYGIGMAIDNKFGLQGTGALVGSGLDIGGGGAARGIQAVNAARAAGTSLSSAAGAGSVGAAAGVGVAAGYGGYALSSLAYETAALASGEKTLDDYEKTNQQQLQQSYGTNVAQNLYNPGSAAIQMGVSIGKYGEESNNAEIARQKSARSAAQLILSGNQDAIRQATPLDMSYAQQFSQYNADAGSMTGTLSLTDNRAVPSSTLVNNRVVPQNRSSGGIIYASNGALAGITQGTDTVPAMLTPGEFVVNREASQRHMPILQAINSGHFNRGGIINYLANGGIVAPRYYAGAGPVLPTGRAQQQAGGVSTNIGADIGAVISEALNSAVGQFNEFASNITTGIQQSMEQYGQISQTINQSMETFSSAAQIQKSSADTYQQAAAEMPNSINTTVTGNVMTNHTGLERLTGNIEQNIYSNTAKQSNMISQNTISQVDKTAYEGNLNSSANAKPMKGYA